jgi:hypothetical protein
MPGYCKEQDGEKKMKVEAKEYRHHRSKDRSKALQCNVSWRANHRRVKTCPQETKNLV